MDIGDGVRGGALDSPSREKWEGCVFTITEFFVPKGSKKKWARLDGGGGVWPLRMLRPAEMTPERADRFVWREGDLEKVED